MRLTLAGGSGFLGTALEAHLTTLGHEVRVLTRRAAAGSRKIRWLPDGTAGPWLHALDGCDAVINLAGEGIADKRWTAERKQALRQSRLLSTRSLVAAVQRMAQPPVLLNASAVGYYGDCGPAVVNEHTEPGAGFLPALCVEWEREAEQASDVTRVSLLRTGVVLHPRGGALAKVVTPFRLGVGGRLGSGEQYFPWIHLQDWLQLVTWIVRTPETRGAINLTAPTPVTNREFTRALGRALGRPTLLPVPAFALQAALGELAQVLLTSQRVVPARAMQTGFSFQFSEIEPALRDLLK